MSELNPIGIVLPSEPSLARHGHQCRTGTAPEVEP